MKINSFRVENVKNVRVVEMKPSQSGLTIIGGKNGQGKTSILDAIVWALGGDKYRPSEPKRADSVIPPYIRITMDNGLVVERKGKNSDLSVTDPSGAKAGQALLNTFIEGLALDLPKFMSSSAKDKAATLLKVIGVGDQLEQLNRSETEAYNRRRAYYQIADQKRKYASEMPFYPDAPDAPVSASELISAQQAILARNGENQRLRMRTEDLIKQRDELARRFEELSAQLSRVTADLDISRKTSEQLTDESTAELEESIRNIEEINVKVRANLDREHADDDARQYSAEYDKMTKALEDIRSAKASLLDGAKLPLPGLSVADGELTYNAIKWDCLASSEQLMVATAIVRAINPSCGFVLMDKLEQLDTDTLSTFGAWLEQEGLQVIATRVSTGDECTIIISDGSALPGGSETLPQSGDTPKWTKGEF